MKDHHSQKITTYNNPAVGMLIPIHIHMQKSVALIQIQIYLLSYHSIAQQQIYLYFPYKRPDGLQSKDQILQFTCISPCPPSALLYFLIGNHHPGLLFKIRFYSDRSLISNQHCSQSFKHTENVPDLLELFQTILRSQANPLVLVLKCWIGRPYHSTVNIHTHHKFSLLE